MRSLSIKSRISLVAVAACVILVAVGTTIQLHFLRNDFARVLTEQHNALASQIADDLDERLQAGMALLAASTRNLPLDEPADAARLRSALALRAVLLTTFDDVLVVDRQGRVLTDEPRLAGRQDMRIDELPWFRRALASGRPMIGEPGLGLAGSEPTVPLAAPVIGERGEVRALLIGVLRLRQHNFLARLATTVIGREGYVSLISKGERPIYIVHPRTERILQPRPRDANPQTTTALNGWEGTGEAVNSRGVKSLYAYRSLSSVDWLLVCALRSDEAFAPIHEAERRAIALALLAVLIVLPMTWMFLRRTLDPLTRLRTAIASLRHSDDEFVAVPITRRDEFGILAAAFNELIDERRTRTAEFEAMNDASPLGIFRSDLTGHQDYVNRTLERLLDAEPGQLLGDRWPECLHEDDRERVLGQWREALANKSAYSNLQRLRRRDGTVRWATVRASPIVVNGEVVGHVGTVDDVTERRESEEARRMLAAIVESSPDFVAMTDAEGRLRYANRAALRLRGVDLDSARGTTIADHYPPEIARRLMEEALPAARRDGSWTGQTAIWDRDRGEVPVHHVVLVGRTIDGKVEFYASLMRDISAELRAERALRDSEQRMRTITDNVPALVSYLDTERRFRFANRAYRLWLGLDPSAILGKTLADVYGAEVALRFDPFVTRALNGEGIDFEHQIGSADRPRDVQVTLIPDRDATEAVIGLHVLFSDVTAKKAEERRLLALSQFDSLTGLLNRSAFDPKLTEAMRRCRERQTRMALMYVDIDRFKSINDTYGHLAGDTILREFTQRMKGVLRSDDVVCRMGGDEFTVIIEPIVRAELAATVAEKIVDVMHEPFDVHGINVIATASIGIAVFDGADPQGVDSEADLLRCADEALYQTKRAGRDSYWLAGSGAGAA